MGIDEIWHRLEIDVEGTIISSETTTGNRPVTYYVLRGNDGVEHHYVAGATDASLPRRLPIGTAIAKQKYALSWKRNGAVVNDFPLMFYLVVCSLGVALAVWGFLQWRLNRPHPPLSRASTHA